MTRQQTLLLQFIERYQLEHQGRCPSFDDMRDALGLKSKSGVHRMLTALEERGYIRRAHYRARSIHIVARPDNAAERLCDIACYIAATDGPERAARALLELAERMMPRAEAA